MRVLLTLAAAGLLLSDQTRAGVQPFGSPTAGHEWNFDAALLDVRDPRRIKCYGYAHWFASEVWDAMLVPVYDARGRQTGKKSNVVYSIDLVRGIDVYSVDVPGSVGILPTGVSAPARSLGDVASAGAAPAGVVLGTMALSLVVRRRSRRTESG